MRRGESSLDPANPGQAQEAVKLSELIEPADNNLVLVDVTPVNRTRNFHNFSLEPPEFFDDLFLRLINQDMPESRELYFLETPAGVRYFVLTRGGAGYSNYPKTGCIRRPRQRQPDTSKSPWS